VTVVEVLAFEGCPNRDHAVELVERVAAELGVRPEVRVVDVEGPDEAERRRFLGSPTVRVDGRDVEPGAETRSEFALSCRVYRTRRGTVGLPDREWIRRALLTDS
jgi:hypothetical protein